MAEPHDGERVSLILEVATLPCLCIDRAVEMRDELDLSTEGATLGHNP